MVKKIYEKDAQKCHFNKRPSFSRGLKCRLNDNHKVNDRSFKEKSGSTALPLFFHQIREHWGKN